MSEIGSRVHAGGRPVRVDEAGVRPTARRHRRDPLLGDEPALGRRLARVHRDRRVERQHLQDRHGDAGRLHLQAVVHLDLDRRRDHLAALREVDPERRCVHALRRARLLLDHGDRLRDQARLRRLPGVDTSARRARSSSASCRCCSSTTSASSCRTGPPRRWRTRRRTSRCPCCAAASHGVLMYVIPIFCILLVLPANKVTGHRRVHRRGHADVPRRLRRRGACAADHHDARLRRCARHVGRGVDDRLRPDSGGGAVRRRVLPVLRRVQPKARHAGARQRALRDRVVGVLPSPRSTFCGITARRRRSRSCSTSRSRRR